MHLYIATKGIKKEVDDFIMQLQGKYLPIQWRAKKEDPMQNSYVQLSVRPVQLWEIGYPEPAHDVVCNTILGKFKDYKGVEGNNGIVPCEHKWINKFIWFFRKCLHLDPVPEWKEEVGQMPICKQAIMVVGLGTKKDYIMDTGVEGI